MIEGETINMGGKEWVVPPLNLKQVRRLGPKLADLRGLSAGATDEQLDAVVAVVHAAISRNYPAVTVEQVEEMLDLGNANDVILAIMGISGLVARGEAQAGSPSNGATSTVTSPPPQDGPSTRSTI